MLLFAAAWLAPALHNQGCHCEERSDEAISTGGNSGREIASLRSQ